MVLTEPCHHEKIAMVMLVTERDHTDKTVILLEGDHPFVKHPSSVDYGQTTYRPAAKLAAAVSNGAAVMQATLSRSVLARVRDGVFASSRTPNEMLEYCKGRW